MSQSISRRRLWSAASICASGAVMALGTGAAPALADSAGDAGLAPVIVTARLRPELGTEQAEQITAAFKAFYLSDLHLGMPSLGCPIAALAGDIAREGEGLKGRFGHGVRRMIELLTRGTVGSERARRARATRNLALMVGAVVIARSCDPQTAQLVLEACRAPTKA